MESSQPALFISDLHLSPLRPEGVERFRRFIRDTASQAESLYILGDFFEAWVGDDQLADPFLAGIVSELRGLGERGVRIGFLPGNRDFLAGEGLARAAGMSLLPDPMRLSLFGVPTLLCHGDLFCTDDRAYRRFGPRYVLRLGKRPFWRSPLRPVSPLPKTCACVAKRPRRANRPRSWTSMKKRFAKLSRTMGSVASSTAIPIGPPAMGWPWTMRKASDGCCRTGTKGGVTCVAMSGVASPQV